MNERADGPDADGAGVHGPSALASLQVLARSSAELGGGLTHTEVYTPQGLLTLFVHAVPARPRAAIIACGGALGGVLGPGHALYDRLGREWSERGVTTYRVGYRVPNDLDRCAHDVACAIEMAVADGATRVAVLGHSFGGAVAIRVAVVMREEVAGVVTFATQAGGCEVAGALGDRPLLLFHGDRDELVPMQASELVRMIAGHGELVVLPGEGHLLARSDEIIVERLEAWLPPVLGTD